MSTKGVFTADQRLIIISAIALIIGGICAVVAVFLLKLIGFFTNLFFYHHLSFAFISTAKNHLGAAVILVPMVGGLIVGLMARYGSDRIRGHGIPEALEAILISRSKMLPKVAVLKPLSSAISIGSGGPFGAEGPIIMTGEALISAVCPSPRRVFRRGPPRVYPGKRRRSREGLVSGTMFRTSSRPTSSKMYCWTGCSRTSPSTTPG
jgi:H+/Cl- antiporter ClcA